MERKEIVLDAIRSSRVDVGKVRGYQVYPEYPVCYDVCKRTIEILNADGLDVYTFDFKVGDTGHCILLSTLDEKMCLYDPTYLQFIEDPDLDSSPDVFVHPIGDRESLSLSLDVVKFPQSLINGYIEGVFWAVEQIK